MRTILISPNETERNAFQLAVQACHPWITLSRVLDDYPVPEVLSRIIRAWAPDTLVFSMQHPEKVEILCEHVSREFEGIQIIGVHGSQDPAVFRRALRLRMRELITPPFDPEHLADLAAVISADLKRRPVNIGTTDRFYAFLPAKPGVGSSTIAANTTWALSKAEGTRVLLADFDLSSGITGFLFNTQHEHSISDAIAQGGQLDEDTWQRLVKPVGNIDLLLSDAPQVLETESRSNTANLIEFARRNYSVINADLPDTLNALSLTVLREANRIFLVTTPELPALRLAKLKVSVLRSLELDFKAVLVVNRVEKNPALTLEEIESTVGLPVFASFGSEYEDLAAAVHVGRASTKLAPAFEAFAEKLLERKIAVQKRRFIERFAVVPARYAFWEAS